MLLKIEELPTSVRTLPTLDWQKISIKSTEIQENHGTGKPRKNGWPEDLVNTAWRMVKTCLTEDGIGLAAPQIGIFKNMIICREFEGDGWSYSFSPAYKLYLNPSFDAINKEGKVSDIEYCLSVPGKGYTISRWKTIIAKWQEFNKSGNLVERSKKMEGFPARIHQHETDHLNGLSIPQRWEMQNKPSKQTSKKKRKK